MGLGREAQEGRNICIIMTDSPTQNCKAIFYHEKKNLNEHRAPIFPAKRRQTPNRRETNCQILPGFHHAI